MVTHNLVNIGEMYRNKAGSMFFTSTLSIDVVYGRRDIK